MAAGEEAAVVAEAEEVAVVARAIVGMALSTTTLLALQFCSLCKD